MMISGWTGGWVGKRHTIEFPNVEHDALHECSVAWFTDQNALLLRFVQVDLQDCEEWSCDEGENDGECPEAPSPIDILVELLG